MLEENKLSKLSLELLFKIAGFFKLMEKIVRKQINMAKEVIKTKSMEETLRETDNKLRGSVKPSEYKHVVLSLSFLKYASDRFMERCNELLAEGKEAFVDNEAFYNAKNVFYLATESDRQIELKNKEVIHLTDLQSLLLAKMGQ